MRIVGGKWRSRTIEAPEGRGTRPSVDRTREAMASMILSAFDLDLSEVVMLDAFAGSGAVGFEMLSRGAKSCTFIEKSRRVADIVRKNAKALGADEGSVHVQTGDTLALASRGAIIGGPFDLVFLDPPYAMEAKVVTQMVQDLCGHGALKEGALVLYEHATSSSGLMLEEATMIRKKKQGISTYELMRLGSGLTT
ncbi:MAG: 16S rRNA (guanine(966)-N(2))-methyltransferase RsmD [Atopobiaceae bacterium]|nr:16S rRNA (guanine(966)-N(2))-methyltransferase RsmD [Atopobiaceae bacterium]